MPAPWTKRATAAAVRAPIIGRVAKVFVAAGDTVAKGDRIAVVEAMKMEHVLHAPRAGRIAKIAVKEGDQVTLGALIAALGEAYRGLIARLPDPIRSGASRERIRSRTPGCNTPSARSVDWMRLTPAFSMLVQAAASEPWVSMPRQASSMT